MQVRSIKRLGWPERIFLVIATVSMLSVVGFSIQGFVSYDRSFQNLTPDGNASGDMARNYTQCNHWTCINDFVYTVAVLVNLGEFVYVLREYIILCMYNFLRCSVLCVLLLRWFAARATV